MAGSGRSGLLALQEGHSQRHQALECSPLAARRRQALRLWCVRRAHRISCGYLYRDDQVHGGAHGCRKFFRAVRMLTPGYPQPERITGTEYTISADVWSTGLSILELVQNRFPFPGDLAPVDLIMHITSSQVSRHNSSPLAKILISRFCKAPTAGG